MDNASFPSATKMDSRELGLIVAQQLLAVEDLHYGWWDGDIPLCLSNLPLAQQRYTEKLLQVLHNYIAAPARVLDVGCGTGKLLMQLLERGYRADAVSPSPYFCTMTAQRLKHFGEDKPKIYFSRFEDLSPSEITKQYDAVIFSESFQYIPARQCFSLLETMLKPGGIILICDFFKKEGQQKCKFGGGHPMQAIEDLIEQFHYCILKNEDITSYLSPNLDLVHDILQYRLSPACATIGHYLKSRHPLAFWCATKLFKRQLDRLQVKYLSGTRNANQFESVKTYRLLVLQRP